MATARKANCKNPRVGKALEKMSKAELIEVVECAAWCALYLERGEGRLPSDADVAKAIAAAATLLATRRGGRPSLGTKYVVALAVEEHTVAGRWVAPPAGSASK